jgi:hypothetical protein
VTEISVRFRFLLDKAKLWKITLQCLTSAIRQRRPFHRDTDAACVLENTGENENHAHFDESWGAGATFYENIDPNLLIIVTAGRSRDLFMDAGY